MTKPKIGWIGLDAPVEILSAIGQAVRVDATVQDDPGVAAAFAEGGGHPWMRAVAGRLVAGADDLKYVVIGSTPVTGVWLYNFMLTLKRGAEAPPLPAAELVNLSHGQRASAERFNRASLARLAERLGAGETAIRVAIAERNAVRAAQRRVERLRYGPDRRLCGVVARQLLDAADQTPVEDFLERVEHAIAGAGDGPVRDDLRAVIYSGPGSPSLALYAALEAQGVCVVGEDADYGSRSIGPDVAVADDPIAALAHRYAHRTPAPAGWTTHARVAWITEFVRERGVNAVLFDLPAWEHPSAWDFPAVRSALESLRVACIELPWAPPSAQAESVAQALDLAAASRGAHG